jgi:hypothetical protein
MKGKPGTILSRVLHKMGFRYRRGCKCKQYAAKMDAEGPDWCQANLDTIVGWLRESAHERRLPFSALAAKALISYSIWRSR